MVLPPGIATARYLSFSEDAVFNDRVVGAVGFVHFFFCLLKKKRDEVGVFRLRRLCGWPWSVVFGGLLLLHVCVCA